MNALDTGIGGLGWQPGVARNLRMEGTSTRKQGLLEAGLP